MNQDIGKCDREALRQAAEELHMQDRDYKRSANISFFLYILVVVLIALGIRAFIGEPIRVEGDSMFPTLLNNERMIVEKLSYYVQPPQRGDIVVCFYPGYTVSCVKRVVGLPGDRISIRGGVVYINGQQLDEGAYWKDIIYSDMGERTVQPGHVFVMGDNRNYSGDSRNAEVGDIPYEKVVGKTVCVMWPLDSIRVFSHVNYA